MAEQTDPNVMTRDQDESGRRPADPATSTSEATPAPATADPRGRRAVDVEHDLIGENLRKLFRSVEEEKVPDRFEDLLKRLADEEHKLGAHKPGERKA